MENVIFHRPWIPRKTPKSATYTYHMQISTNKNNFPKIGWYLKGLINFNLKEWSRTCLLEATAYELSNRW